HHGSLEREQRRKVEAAMARGALRAVVATSSLDLGIDWAAVDLVVQVGAPKGASRLVQRIGRANHRLDEPSRALLVPANRFEMLECRAALEAVAEHTLDGEIPRSGSLDVLCQHILGMACSTPIDEDELFEEVTSAGPYASLEPQTFYDAVQFVADGGYVLDTYDRWHRMVRNEDGHYKPANSRVVQRYRMNIGTIVEAPTLKVRLTRGRGAGAYLGEVEEYFVNGLVPGDTFVFAGRLLRFDGIREHAVIASPAVGDAPKVPAYVGGRLPLTTHLADRVRAMLADPSRWSALPDAVSHWLRLQQWRSVLPRADGLLVETFPRGDRYYLVAYCFEGRNAHQTLGMLLTRRLERMGFGPLGFVATDYVVATWSLREPGNLDALFDEDMLGDDLEAWMDESSLLKRTFRNVAVVAGLIERKQPGHEKTGRQVTFNADLIYNVLRRHQPNHILLQATRQDAATGLTDIRRIAGMLGRVKGKITHRSLDRVSPLAVPVLLEVGKESVYGSALDELLSDVERELIEEATGDPDGTGRAPALPL
nr:helicase-related protein [Alphaproteobacteria bacterium]